MNKKHERSIALKINEVAKISGVTVRTLHYYDEIGLLAPSKTTDNGYRIYGEAELENLQQILFFRELEFSLSDIKEIMANASYDKKATLSSHKNLLIKKRDRLNEIIGLCENMIKGDNKMSFKEFDMSEIERAKSEYSDEAKKLYGTTSTYAESEARTGKYTKEDWARVMGTQAELFEQFAKCRALSPSCDEAQALVKRWQDYITDNFYTCTNEILSGLGLMYTEDERFMKNIDKHGEGTAKFMSEAIALYCGK